MVTVIFYEKPGCVTNARQKKLLAAGGHQIVAKDLLAEPWEVERLRPFFGNLAVRDWFNYSAPAIKSGDINPDRLTETEALTLMLDNPLLIRRPLMQVGENVMAGFDPQTVDIWIGLTELEPAIDMERCSHTHSPKRCGHE